MHDAFLSYSVEKLHQYEERIAVCLRKLTDEQIWQRGSEEQNALGNIVIHLCGNLTEWILQALGGEAPSRDRDAEFNARAGKSREELIADLHGKVDSATAVIARLTPERLAEEVSIQRCRLPVLQAVYHVVEHFSLHAGQIMFATKLMTSEELGFYGHQKLAQHSEKNPS